MGSSHRADRGKEKEKLTKDDPDEDFEIMLIAELLESNSFSLEEFKDCLTIQRGIYNSLNQQERGTPIQNDASVETGQSSKVHPFSTQNCPICMEPKYIHETFTVGGCFHVFCLDCIRGHIEAKVQENAAMIRCPESNCESVLEFELCRLVLPPKLLERWGDLLCESAIQTINKFYCPFKDCSALILVDDADNGITLRESECPHCFRLFCARCKVPWHSDFRCEDFQMLRADERGREDIMLMKLAKEEEWQRCPNCGYFVERTHGCSFMKCRCKHCFCYKCGAQMDERSHHCSKCNE